MPGCQLWDCRTEGQKNRELYLFHCLFILFDNATYQIQTLEDFRRLLRVQTTTSLSGCLWGRREKKRVLIYQSIYLPVSIYQHVKISLYLNALSFKTLISLLLYTHTPAQPLTVWINHETQLNPGFVSVDCSTTHKRLVWQDKKLKEAESDDSPDQSHCTDNWQERRCNQTDNMYAIEIVLCHLSRHFTFLSY